MSFDTCHSASHRFVDPRSLREIQNAYNLLVKRTKKLLSMTICDMAIRIGAGFWTQRNKEQREGQTEMEVEIV